MHTRPLNEMALLKDPFRVNFLALLKQVPSPNNRIGRGKNKQVREDYSEIEDPLALSKCRVNCIKKSSLYLDQPSLPHQMLLDRTSSIPRSALSPPSNVA